MRLGVLVAFALVLVLVCLAVLLGGRCGCPADGAQGGAPAGRARPRPAGGPSPHLVVDTLNLAHWLRRGEADGPLSPELIVAAIDRSAPALKARHPGRVMYVLKDRETQFNDESARELYRQAAERNRVYVTVAERYPDPPAGVKPSAEHSSRARDDFLMALLARRWRCAVLTEDRLRDFDRFRDTVSPFHAYEYAYWRRLPAREFVRPDSAAYARLGRPELTRYAEYPGIGT